MLTDFHGKAIPPYAILSHRWGDSEVLFADMGRETYKEKSGYQKLEFCAKRAAQDGLQYFWSDTCCINKWDLRELSKSINSMFLWYRNAERCYTYLSDVSVLDVKENSQQLDWEASFRASKWFTRGWTLQELIAPSSVEFFSCEGRRIGDKSSLEQMVHDITQIPIRALRNCPLNEFTVSDRMKWATSRVTTEPEDNVYCLLGILDISMPTTYGEGKEKAWTRLFAEIEAADSAPSIIPFSRNDHFVGREPQLDELEAKLFSDKQTTTLAIVGHGGTGKSQLALELAYRTRQKDKDCSIFWIDASNTESLHQSFANIAQKLGIPGWNDDQAYMTQSFAGVARSPKIPGWNGDKVYMKDLLKLRLVSGDKGSRRCLLIFDNMDGKYSGSRGLPAVKEADVIDYLPHSELCSVVFTTIDKDTARRLALQNVVELRGLTPDMAQQMLKNYLVSPISESELQETEALLQELAYFPLAIVQAAAYINVRGMTVHEYRSQYNIQKEKQQNSPLRKPSLYGYHSLNPTAITLFVSMDQIRIDNPSAADYLFFAASLDQKDIPLELLDAPPFEREEALKVLSSYALIIRRPAESAVDLNPLVHQALWDWLRRHLQLNQWGGYAIIRLLVVFPDPDHRNRSKWKRLMPHVRHALKRSFTESERQEKLLLMGKYALTLLIDGQYHEAEQQYLQILEMLETHGDSDEDLNMLTCRANLSYCYKNQGRFEEAEQLQLRYVETCSRVLGDEDPSTTSGMCQLAMTYRHQGRYKEAEELQEKLLALYLRKFGPEHHDTIIGMSQLAATYQKQERWKEAEELGLQLVDISKKLLGAEHPETLIVIGNLAVVYSSQGRWKEAEEFEVYAVETSKRVLGDEHPEALCNMASLAYTYWKQRRFGKAERLYVDAIEGKRKVLGDGHLYTLRSINDLASMYASRRRWKAAEELWKPALETWRKVHGDKNPGTRTTMSQLAIALMEQERYEEALPHLETLIELHKEILDEQNPVLKQSIELLGRLRVKISELDPDGHNSTEIER
jgi:tetratricopeptide (TPR) repeat protein